MYLYSVFISSSIGYFRYPFLILWHFKYNWYNAPVYRFHKSRTHILRCLPTPDLGNKLLFKPFAKWQKLNYFFPSFLSVLFFPCHFIFSSSSNSAITTSTVSSPI